MNKYEEMSYKELSSEVYELKKNICDLTDKFTGIRDSLTKESEIYNSFDKLKLDEIDRNKQEALNVIIKNKTELLQSEIESFVEKRNRADENYKAHLKTITMDKFIDEDIQKELDDTKEILEVIEECKEVIREHLGDNFYNSLMERFSEGVTEVNIESATALLDVFQSASKQLKRVKWLTKFSLTTKITSLFNALSHKLNPDKDISNGKLKSRLYISIIGGTIISGLLIWKGLLILLVILIIMSVLNTYISYKIYKLAYNIKSVEDNINKIEDLYNKEIKNNMLSVRNKAGDKYLAYTEGIDSKILELQTSLTEQIQSVKDNFKFDATDIESEFKEKYKSKQKTIDDLNVEKVNLESKIELCNSDIAKIEALKVKKVDEFIDDKINSTTPGVDRVFDGEFLMDYDRNRKEPIMWKHPKKNSIYLYNDENDANDFIKGTTNQLLTKMYFDCFNVIYYDQFTFGDPLLSLKASIRNISTFFLLDIITDEDSFKSKYDELLIEIGNLKDKMFTHGGNVEEYNADMEAIDSKTSPYRFVYIKNADPRMLQDERFAKMNDTCSSCGIYFHLLFDKSKLSSLSKNCENVLKNYDNFYELFNGKIRPISLQGVMKLINSD